MRLPIFLLLATHTYAVAAPRTAAVPGAAVWTAAASVSPAPTVPSVAAIVEPAGGRVGFAALDLQSGRSIAWQADERFPTQSVFKLPIAIEVLLRADAGRLDLARSVSLEAADARGGPRGTLAVPTTRTIGELLEAMIIHSDNVACDKLLTLIGGPAAVDARMHKLGIEGITIRFSERQMYEGGGAVDNTATPHALVNLLAKIARRQLGLSTAGAARLEELLGRVATGQKRLKAELPPGTPVAHKTGTGETRGGVTDATNDVGLVTLPDGHRFAIAVFVHASPAEEAIRERTIAKLARLAFDTFRQPAGDSASVGVPLPPSRDDKRGSAPPSRGIREP
jgi:beta-lactamase class A